MKPLTETPFFLILKKIIKNHSEDFSEEFIASFDEFITDLTEFTKAKIPIEDLIRQFKYATAELIASQTIIRIDEAGKKCLYPYHN